MPHCPVTVVQSYRDWVYAASCSTCNLPSLYPPSFTDFWLCQCTQCTIYNIGAKKRFVYYINYHFLLHYWSSLLIPPFPCSRIFFVVQHAGIEHGPHRYDATLLTSRLCYTRSHKPRIVYTNNTSLNFHTRVCVGEEGGAHYPKWRRSLLIRAETRDFHSRRGNGEELSLGDDAHLRPS